MKILKSYWPQLLAVAVILLAAHFAPEALAAAPFVAIGSTQIPVGFEQKYAADFLMLAQQKGSRLRDTVRDDPTAGAKAFYFDRVGKAEMQQKTSRGMDTPLSDTPHSRRKVTPSDFVRADIIDRADLLKMTKNPQNAYMTANMWAAGRKFDDVIIAAARGNAVSVDQDDASSNVALPSAQKVAAASAGLTKAKILAAKQILDENEIDDADRYFVISSKQLQDLLGITEVTSSDYNTVKALVEGQLNTWLGFTFKRTERLPTSGTTRYNIAYQKNAMGLWVPEDVMTRVTERADKNYSIQVYVEMSTGATRIEDEGVVEIACIES